MSTQSGNSGYCGNCAPCYCLCGGGFTAVVILLGKVIVPLPERVRVWLHRVNYFVLLCTMFVRITRDMLPLFFKKVKHLKCIANIMLEGKHLNESQKAWRDEIMQRERGNTEPWWTHLRWSELGVQLGQVERPSGATSALRFFSIAYLFFAPGLI